MMTAVWKTRMRKTRWRQRRRSLFKLYRRRVLRARARARMCERRLMHERLARAVDVSPPCAREETSARARVCVRVCARAPSRRKVVGTERRRGSAGGAGGKTTARRRDRRWNGRLLGGGGGKRPGRAAGRREIAEGMITGYHRGDQPTSSRGDLAGCASYHRPFAGRDCPHRRERKRERERERKSERERERKLWRRLDGVAALRLAAVIAAAFRLDWTGLDSALADMPLSMTHLFS